MIFGGSGFQRATQARNAQSREDIERGRGCQHDADLILTPCHAPPPSTRAGRRFAPGRETSGVQWQKPWIRYGVWLRTVASSYPWPDDKSWKAVRLICDVLWRYAMWRDGKQRLSAGRKKVHVAVLRAPPSHPSPSATRFWGLRGNLETHHFCWRITRRNK